MESFRSAHLRLRLQSLEEDSSDEDKILRLVSYLAADEVSDDSLDALRDDARAAQLLADDHLAVPPPRGRRRDKRAPAVLLAALAMSAVSAIQRNEMD